MASMIGFFVGRAIAERQGLSPDAAMKYGAFGAVGGTSPTSILLVDIAAKREAEAQPQQQDTTSTTVTVPDVISHDLDTAQGEIANAKLQPVVKAETNTKLVVVRSDPKAETKVSAGRNVQLFIADSSVTPT
jgi:hypothetical protein